MREAFEAPQIAMLSHREGGTVKREGIDMNMTKEIAVLMNGTFRNLATSWSTSKKK